MPAESTSRFLEQLRVLCRHEVDFIVVGGVAAVFESKEHANRDKDRAVLPILRRTLAIARGG